MTTTTVPQNIIFLNLASVIKFVVSPKLRTGRKILLEKDDDNQQYETIICMIDIADIA